MKLGTGHCLGALEMLQYTCIFIISSKGAIYRGKCLGALAFVKSNGMIMGTISSIVQTAQTVQLKGLNFN